MSTLSRFYCGKYLPYRRPFRTTTRTSTSKRWLRKERGPQFGLSLIYRPLLPLSSSWSRVGRRTRVSAQPLMKFATLFSPRSMKRTEAKQTLVIAPPSLWTSHLHHLISTTKKKTSQHKESERTNKSVSVYIILYYFMSLCGLGELMSPLLRRGSISS